MPKVSAKREKINAAKSGAPKVPGDTCPTINYVQEIVGQIADRGTSMTFLSMFVTQTLSCVNLQNTGTTNTRRLHNVGFKNKQSC